MLVRSDSSGSSGSPADHNQLSLDSDRQLEELMNTTKDKLELLEKELNRTPTESIANLFMDLFDSGLGSEDSANTDWFARCAELLDEFKSVHRKVEEVEERNQALSHLNIDLLRRNFQLETMLQNLGVDLSKENGGFPTWKPAKLTSPDMSVEKANGFSNSQKMEPSSSCQSSHSKSSQLNSQLSKKDLQLGSSSTHTEAVSQTSSKTTEGTSLDSVQLNSAATDLKKQLSQSTSVTSEGSYQLCDHCHQIIYPLDMYSNLQLENNQLKYQLIHLESTRLSLEFRIMILKQEVVKLKEANKDRCKVESQVISLLEETSYFQTADKEENRQENFDTLDDVSLCRDYSDAVSAGDSCLIQSSSQEKSVSAKNNNNNAEMNKLSAQVAKLKAKISKLKNSKALLKLRTRELLSEYRKKRDILKQRDEQLTHVKVWLTKLHALHVRQQATHADILENVKEELRIIATLALQAKSTEANQNKIHTDLVNNIPDYSNFNIPDYSNLNNHATFNHIVPDNSTNISDLKTRESLNTSQKTQEDIRSAVEMNSSQSRASTRSADHNESQSESSVCAGSSVIGQDISSHKIENLFGLIKSMLVTRSNNRINLGVPDHKDLMDTSLQLTLAVNHPDTFPLESLVCSPKPVSVGRQ